VNAQLGFALPRSLQRPPRLSSPAGAALVALSLVGIAIAMVAGNLVGTSGWLRTGEAYGHAVVALTLLMAAWALCAVGVRLAKAHARRRFLRRLPNLYHKLSRTQAACAIACLQSAARTVARPYNDSAARSLCGLGILLRADTEPHSRGGEAGTRRFTMPEDVADAFLAYFEDAMAAPGEPRSRATNRPAIG
jgi:hypothetical protein